MKEKVIELALKGLSDMKIADELNIIDHYCVTQILKEAKAKDPNLDYQIQMARYLNHRVVIDKDLLDDIIALNAQNFSREEMALLLDRDYEEIIEHINALHRSSLYQDEEAYQKIMETQEKLATTHKFKVYQRLEDLKRQGFRLDNIHSMRLDRFEFYQKVKNLLQEYLDFNMQIPDDKLAARYDLSIDFLRGILNGTMNRDLVSFLIGEEGIQKIRKYREQNLLHPSTEHLFDQRNLTEEEKKAISYLKKNINFWISFVLTFRLSLDDLAYFTFYPSTSDITILQKNLFSFTNYLSKQALDYLFFSVSHKKEDVLQRRKKAREYILKLNAAAKKGKDEYLLVLGEINDGDYKKLVSSQKKINRYTEEDWRIVLNYHIKYALSFSQSFYRDQTLRNHCPDDLRSEFQQLKDYLREESINRLSSVQRGL